MNFLIIDTSCSQSFVCFVKGEALAVELLPPSKQSQTLLPSIKKLLNNETLDFIAVGTGPGSFTGTRVGVMTAKTLAFAKSLPLLPFCSLKIFTPEKEGPFTLYGDGKSRGFYTLRGSRTGGEVHYEPPTLEAGGGPLSDTLNLPFLATYLKRKFTQEGGAPHHAIAVSYGDSPYK